MGHKGYKQVDVVGTYVVILLDSTREQCKASFQWNVMKILT